MNPKATTLCEIISGLNNRPSDQIAIKFKNKTEWSSLSWQQYYNLIEKTACGLIEMGVKKGDKVAIYSDTRYEWSVTDCAIISIGAVTVPIYQTVTNDDLEYILNDSEASIIICENEKLLRNVKTVQSKCTSLKKIILIDTGKNIDSEEMTWIQLTVCNDHVEEFKKRISDSKSSDLLTLIYTSGTTGFPKGVVITHEQAISEVSEAFPLCGMSPSDVALTFLPYAHILGRVEHWGHLYIGHTLAFAESIEKVKSNLQDIKPTVMVAVPRIFEKIYAAIWSQVESNFASTQVFRWALTVGLKVGQLRLRHESIPATLLAEYVLAQKLALNKVKSVFGGRLRFAISGGAPIARDIALFFHAAEVLILEGYGLTETTAAICVNTPHDYKFGSVGKPIGDVKIKIAEDGEILVKSKKIMKAYYKNPEETKNAISEDGWFHTGDIGEITPTGDIRITDRKKDLIKTAGGKYVAPQKLENILKTNNFISQALIHGDMKKYIVALITIDKSFLVNFAKEKNIEYKDYAQLTQSHQVLELVRKTIAETNSHLANYETIKRFAILPHDFTVEAGELTPSLKLKRKFLDKKYRQQIDSLYN